MSRMQPARTAPLAALKRIACKQAIIAELVSGRLSLLTATVRFLEAETAAGTETGNIEHWCRTVIAWALLALSDRPERAATVSSRLESELQSHLTDFGQGRLALEKS